MSLPDRGQRFWMHPDRSRSARRFGARDIRDFVPARANEECPLFFFAIWLLAHLIGAVTPPARRPPASTKDPHFTSASHQFGLGIAPITACLAVCTAAISPRPRPLGCLALGACLARHTHPSTIVLTRAVALKPSIWTTRRLVLTAVRVRFGVFGTPTANPTPVEAHYPKFSAREISQYAAAGVNISILSHINSMLSWDVCYCPLRIGLFTTFILSADLRS